MEKTLEDYQKIHNNLRRYCEHMIEKFYRNFIKFHNIEDLIKVKAYEDILFKLNTDKNK